MSSRYRNRAIVGRPFTIQLDVETYDHDTDTCTALPLTGATGLVVRLIPPVGSSGTQSDQTGTLPGSPTNRLEFTGTGAELDIDGTWSIVGIYTLSGSTRETFPVAMPVEAAS